MRVREFERMAISCGSLVAVLTSVLVVASPVWAVEKKEWAAKWIWDNGKANPTNYFLMLRRNFRLATKPESAVLHLTSANRYKLFLNGQYVGRGPARSDPRWKSFDSYQVAKHI